MDQLHRHRCPVDALVLGSNLLSDVQPLGPKTNILDLEDFILSITVLPSGALIFVFFCTSRWGWNWNQFLEEANTGEGLKIPLRAKIYMLNSAFRSLHRVYQGIPGYFSRLSQKSSRST